MLEDKLRVLLEQIKKGELEIEEAVQQLKTLPFSDLDFAKIDTHRALRRGFGEVIFCEGKTHEQLTQIATTLLKSTGSLLATRASKDAYKAIKKSVPRARYYPQAKIVIASPKKAQKKAGQISVVTAGTADIPVAEEAVLTAEALGNHVHRLYDVGVAGLHRLLAHQKELLKARVIVAVAGMEGALPSIIGGLVSCPVIAVPTSIGYGASFEGLAALLTMLNSCAPGVAVVNIDNGFGAGYLAAIINQQPEKLKAREEK